LPGLRLPILVPTLAAGIAYGLFYSQPQYAQGSDTWRFFEASRTETDWLLRDPVAFFKDLFIYGYKESGSLFIANDSYWNDLKSNVIIKLMAVFNALTLKNYYADIIFFNFLFLFGPVAFYRVIKEKVHANKIVFLAFIFCIPSFLFWCSGMHKDGLIFTAVALIIFYFKKLAIFVQISAFQLFPKNRFHLPRSAHYSSHFRPTEQLLGFSYPVKLKRYYAIGN